MRLPKLKQLLLTQVGAQISNFSIQFLSVPIFISFWHNNLYGVWLTLMAVPLFIAQVDIGFGSASAPAMAKATHENRFDVARSYFWAGLIATMATGLAAAAIAAAFVYYGNVTKNIVGISARDVHIVVFSGLGIAILSMLLRCGWSLLLAADRQFVGDLSVNATFVTEGLASLAIVACGGTPVVLAVSLVVMRFAWVCVVFALGAKHGPWIWSRENLSVGSITQAIRNLWRPATGYFADPLSNVLQTQGSVFLVGYLLGPALAPVVYSHRLLTRVAWQLSGGVRSTTNGELVRLFAVGDRAGLRKYGLLIISVYMWVALLCFFGLAILGPFVMKIWVRDKSIFDPILFELFVLSVPFSGILYGAKAILAAENDHYQLSRTELVFTIIAFLAMVGMLLLTQELWIVGLAMAVLSILLYFVSLNHLARKMDSTPYAVATAAVTALPSVAWSRSVYQYRKFSERKLRPR